MGETAKRGRDRTSGSSHRRTTPTPSGTALRVSSRLGKEEAIPWIRQAFSGTTVRASLYNTPMRQTLLTGPPCCPRLLSLSHSVQGERKDSIFLFFLSGPADQGGRHLEHQSWLPVSSVSAARKTPPVCAVLSAKKNSSSPRPRTFTTSLPFRLECPHTPQQRCPHTCFLADLWIRCRPRKIKIHLEGSARETFPVFTRGGRSVCPRNAAAVSMRATARRLVVTVAPALLQGVPWPEVSTSGNKNRVSLTVELLPG